jgi:hypothetical protein
MGCLHRWASASAEQKLSAEAAYRAALDREEAAANSYAERIELARDLLDSGSDLPAVPGGSD